MTAVPGPETGRTSSMATTDTDVLLVRQVRAGDAEAWRQLIERFEGRLLAFVDSRLRDRAASEDVVQETFIGFLTSLPHYDEKRDMEAYLFSIAAHKLTDHLRKQGRRPIDQFGSDDHGRPLDEVPGGARAASSIARSGERRKAEEQLLGESMGQLVREWLAREDYDRIRCLELLIVKGWANKDVARYMDIPEQAVASYKFQTIARLKEMARRAGLSPDDLARVEKALRDSATLRARLEDVRNNRDDFQLHSLGAIWLRSRLTCPGRQHLGSYLLDALEPELASYIKFHIEVVECPYCQANLVDLERQQSGHPTASTDREKRILNATRDLLGEEGRGK